MIHALEPSTCPRARPAALGSRSLERTRPSPARPWGRLRQRVLRVALEAGGQLQDPPRVAACRRDAIGQRRCTVGERTGLVQDDRAAPIDLLEHGRVADDDATPRGEGNRADDRDRDRDEERTRCGDDEHRKEAKRVAAPEPGDRGETEGNRRVPRAEYVAEPAEPRTLLLRIAHDAHDARVSRVHGDADRAEGQRCLTVDRAGEDLGARRLRHHERLAG